MPFRSTAQMKKCYATNGFGGKVDCNEWQKNTPKKLPKHVKKLRPKKKMAQGGPIPKQSDFPDYESFQAALEAYVQFGDNIGNDIGTPIPQSLWHNDPTFDDGLAPYNPTKPVDSEGYRDPNYHQQPMVKTPSNGSQIDPYFMLRGALNGAQWLGGKRERNRQDQYIYDQYSTLGQLDPINTPDYQPNPFSLYARFGGSINKMRKMAEGGEIEDQEDPKQKKKPIITSNRNDPRLRAYNDSLNLYKGFLQGRKYIDESVRQGIHLPPTLNSPIATEGLGFIGVNTIDQVKNINPVATFTYPHINSYNGTKFGDAYLHEYKKPVQPVVYQPEVLADKKQYKARVRGNIIPSVPVIEDASALPAAQVNPQPTGQPVYGPAKSLIGYGTKDGFTPAYSAKSKANKADSDLMADPERLKQYLRGKGYQFKKGGSVKALRPKKMMRK